MTMMTQHMSYTYRRNYALSLVSWLYIKIKAGSSYMSWVSYNDTVQSYIMYIHMIQAIY